MVSDSGAEEVMRTTMGWVSPVHTTGAGTEKEGWDRVEEFMASGPRIPADHQLITELRAEVERLTQENTRMAGEIEVWRVINARALDFANAERDVIEKAKEWRTFAQEPTMHGWSAEEEALIAAVDALGDSQGDTDGQ